MTYCHRNETEHQESSLLNPANAARELGMSIATAGDRNDEGTNQHRAQVYRMEDEYAALNPCTMVKQESPTHFTQGGRGGVHGSAHVRESKYFFAFARYDPSLFNLIRCL